MYEGSLIGAGSVVFALMGYAIANQKPELGGGGERLVVTLNPKLLGMIFGDGEGPVREALEYLCKPDPESNTKAEEGRRLVRLAEFDYWVVNGRYYRDLGKEDRRREQNRAAAKKYRQKQAEKNGGKSAAQVQAESDGREKRALAAPTREEAEEITAENLPTWPAPESEALVTEDQGREDEAL